MSQKLAGKETIEGKARQAMMIFGKTNYLRKQGPGLEDRSWEALCTRWSFKFKLPLVKLGVFNIWRMAFRQLKSQLSTAAIKCWHIINCSKLAKSECRQDWNETRQKGSILKVAYSQAGFRVIPHIFSWRRLLLQGFSKLLLLSAGEWLSFGSLMFYSNATWSAVIDNAIYHKVQRSAWDW